MPDDISNIRYIIDDDDVLTIQIDLKKRLGETKKGGSMLIATSRGVLRLQSKYGQIRPEYMSLNISIPEPAPISETQRLLEHAMNSDIESSVKEILALVLQCVQGYPKLFREWLQGGLNVK